MRRNLGMYHLSTASMDICSRPAEVRGAGGYLLDGTPKSRVRSDRCIVHRANKMFKLSVTYHVLSWRCTPSIEIDDISRFMRRHGVVNSTAKLDGALRVGFIHDEEDQLYRADEFYEVGVR